MAAIVIGALVIGITLGLLGSGGSALTVPVLIYLVGHDAKISIAESMAIVGLICIAAAFPYARNKSIDWHSVIYFGIPGMIGTYIGAQLGGISSDTLQLATFGLVLILAATFMLRKAFQKISTTETQPTTPELNNSSEGNRRPTFKHWLAVPEGIAVGIVTGFVGVGGGFLIVPALMIFAKLPTRVAIGTSLAIIALKSAIGFIKYEYILLSAEMNVDMVTILLFSLIGILGSLLGQQLNLRLNQRRLQQVFAIFLVVVGCYITLHEGTKLLGYSTGSNTSFNTIESTTERPRTY